MSAVLDFLVGAAVVVGLFFHTMGVLGILRFPDVYTRLHADTKATTFGSIFIALAAILTAVRYGVAAAPGEGGAWANVVVHIAFAVVVLAVTNATGGHAIARAAWRAGHRPAEAVVDALAADAAAKATGEPEAMEAMERMEAMEGAEATETAEAPVGPEIPEVPDNPEIPEGTEGTGEARREAAPPEGEAVESGVGGEEAEGIAKVEEGDAEALARLEAAPPEGGETIFGAASSEAEAAGEPEGEEEKA